MGFYIPGAAAIFSIFTHISPAPASGHALRITSTVSVQLRTMDHRISYNILQHKKYHTIIQSVTSIYAVGSFLAALIVLFLSLVLPAQTARSRYDLIFDHFSELFWGSLAHTLFLLWRGVVRQKARSRWDRKQVWCGDPLIQLVARWHQAQIKSPFFHPKLPQLDIWLKTKPNSHILLGGPTWDYISILRCASV